MKYVKEYADENKLPQISKGKSIYVSSVVYFDFTSKLIELYNRYSPYAKDVNVLLSRISNEIIKIFIKILNFNKMIYAFVDYKKLPDIDECNVLFRDFICTRNDLDDYERMLSLPVIEKKYLPTIKTDETLLAKVRCKFEIHSLKNMEINEEDYMNLVDYMKEICNGEEYDDELFEAVEKLINHGWYRYLLLRGAKRNTIRERTHKLFHDNRGGNGTVPFSVVLYSTPVIVKKVSECVRLKDCVNFFGCCVESDFALSRHVRTYNKFTYPTVYSNDTDMIALLSDIDCAVKFTIKDGFGKGNNIVVNPKEFWHKLFGCDLSPAIVRIICVLMGTDYNPYHPKSPIHIRRLSDVLDLMDVDEFQKIDEDKLRFKLYMIMNENKGNIHVMQTAMALNIYLNNNETDLHVITGNEHVEYESYMAELIGFIDRR